jgi:hypothetical protein
MPACELKPDDKKQFISDVGQDLVRRHGKQKYYPPDEVRQSRQSAGYPLDIECWAMVIFTTPEDFEFIHQAVGDACDYAAMKTEVLTDLAGTSSFWLPDVSLSWLEWPDIDLSSLFDWFDFTP